MQYLIIPLIAVLITTCIISVIYVVKAERTIRLLMKALIARDNQLQKFVEKETNSCDDRAEHRAD